MFQNNLHLKNVTGTAAAISGLDPVTTYNYHVVAFNSVGDSAPSNSVAVTTGEAGGGGGEAPRALKATADVRQDGPYTLHGIRLDWAVGANDGSEGEPGDWNGGNAPYPKQYEVSLNGSARQTVYLDWCGWYDCWKHARTHWVLLGENPEQANTVKIRAKLSNGQWSEWTNEVVTNPNARLVDKPVTTQMHVADQDIYHGNLLDPMSRSMRCRGDNPGQDKMCVDARAAGIYYQWSQIQPKGEDMIANPPFNSSRRYSEYRKFSLGFDVCGAGNTDNLGLNLLPDATRSWASTDFGGVNGSYTFKYRYTAYHPGEYWTHDWYITKLGWQPSDGISWASLEPVPFMVGHLAALDEYHTDTMPARTGAAAIVQVWSGPGGPDLPKPPPNPQFPKAGEFFTSCSDVDFGQQLLRR